MNTKQFNEVVNEQIDIVKSTLIKKQGEYNLDDDRLGFFKHNASFLNKTPEQALWYMSSKHFISLTDMIESGKAFDEAVWNEKITDAINYLILLKGLVRDTGKATIKENK